MVKTKLKWIISFLLVAFLFIEHTFETNTESRKYRKPNRKPNNSQKQNPVASQDRKDELNFEGFPTSQNLNEIMSSMYGRQSTGDSSIEISKIDEALKFGIHSAETLINVQEPLWYEMGLYLDKDHPASKVADFGKPNRKALELSKYGFATLEASRKVAQSFPENISRQFPDFPSLARSRILEDDCPLKGKPRCPLASQRYRTADGTCNNLAEPWKGSAMLPLQRFLPPIYEDGIQSIRRSVLGPRLPSARDISVKIHGESNKELKSVTLMFMQWGQFIDHDITSVVKSRSFNGSIPRCCDGGGRRMLPPELTHPSCLPISVSSDDWFFGKFGIRCMEFLRSAPSTRIDCDLGWREQINQVTPFIDASTIYGSDIEISDSIRTFRNGKITYGRNDNVEALQPPDPPGGELCRAGALTTDCFEPGDGRVTEQPGLTAVHTVWIRFHNKVATVLSRNNPHWSDEKIFQETRKIVQALIQHITYHEFLPILLGPEVVRLFELDLVRKGYYDGYDGRINPGIANSFSAAAYRFGHSMVQNSFIRTDHNHKPIFNNVSLHEEMDNFENIWSFGSIDRLLLGFCNQPSQRRDEFICDELTNHLFQPFNLPFGMDLTAINIQRGRDHGIPPYTSWRQPCGLSPVKEWKDLLRIFNVDTVERFRRVYRHVDDIDLFSGGLAEKPVRGGVIGPTFGCIIAQQFLNLRKGDRFWYENGKFQSSFTPAQLQQIRRITFSKILCQTMTEIESIQTFVFLAADDIQNVRVLCDSSAMKNFDLSPWIETTLKDIDNRVGFDFGREGTDQLDADISSRGRKIKTKNRNKPKTQSTTTKINVKGSAPKYSSDVKTETHYNRKSSNTADKPLEVNIKIQYFFPTTTTTSTTMRPRKKKKRPPVATTNDQSIIITQKPFTNKNPNKINPSFTQSTSQTNSYASRPNIRPTFIYDRPTSDNDYSLPGSRPSHIYNRPVSTVNNQNSNNVRPLPIHDRPSSGFDIDNYRPTNSYSRPSSPIAINIPSDEYNFGSNINRPISNYDNDIISVDQFSYNSGRPKPDTNYQNPGFEDYDEVIFESEPFSTSQRPYVYKPSSNNYVFTYYNTQQRPQQSSYDPISDYSYTQNDRYDIPKRPSFGQPSPSFINDKVGKPNKIYSVGHVYSLDDDRIHDKLDFKTRVVTKIKDDRNKTRYVKISSVKTKAILSSSNAFFDAVLQRDGDDEIVERGDEDERTMRLVDIDVTPSEMNHNNWLVYNETDDPMPTFFMPDFNLHTSCSEEIPKPIMLKTNENFHKTNDLK
ncbi:uncharacterized protein [Leptinotarsa decemlineata]|uniref:uncharacterized protein n=1 Tax=Leptinotarsa decemlineata TaxID=7539 RepID=UPI003D304371